MNRKIVLSAVAITGGAALYLAGVANSGKVANQYIQQQVEYTQDQLQGQAFLHLQSQPGFFKSTHELVYTFAESTPELDEMLGGREIPLLIEVEHTPLGANSRIVLAQGALKDKLSAYLADANAAPFDIRMQQRISPWDKTVSIRGELSSQALTIPLPDGDGVVEVAALTGTFSQLGKMFEMDAGIPSVEFKGDKGALTMTGISLFERAEIDQEDPLRAVMPDMFDGGFKLASMTFTKGQTGEQPEWALKAGYATVKQHTDNNRVVVAVNYGAESVEVMQAPQAIAVTAPNLSLTFDIDEAATRTLAQTIQAMQVEDENMQQAQVAQLLEAADQLTQAGINAAIPDVSVGWDGQKAVGSLDATLSPFALNEVMMQPFAALEYLSLNAQVVLPKKMAEALPEEMQMQLAQIAALGFLSLEGEQYQTKVVIEQGEMQVNGQPVPLF